MYLQRIRGYFYVAVMLVAVPMPAWADDWGCEVMLCLSDPRGASTEAACVPPVSRLWQTLAHGGSLPVCTLVQDSYRGFTVAMKLQDTTIDQCPTSLLVYGEDGPTGCRASKLIEVRIDDILMQTIYWLGNTSLTVSAVRDAPNEMPS